MRRSWSPLAAVALAAVAVACGADERPDSAGSDGDRLAVVTTVSPITSIAANIAGSAAVVTGIVPEGVNSHEFQPRPSLARTLADADLVFVNGLDLEVPTAELAQANLGRGAELIELGARAIGRDEWIYDFSFPASGGHPNPHLWTNPPYALRFAEIIADELIEADPANAAGFRRNLTAFRDRIRGLDAAIRAATATVPAERRKLLTYHDSFPYFAREYGWEIVGAIQPSDFSEPTPREVARLIEQVRDEGVPAVFGSEVFPSPVLEQIGREAGVRFVDTLRDDDLPGEPGDPEHSYLGLMRTDVATIVSALGGDPAPLEAVDVSDVSPHAATYA